MLFTTGRSQDSFASSLKENLAKSEIVYIVAAYVSISGLCEIAPYIQRCREVRIIVGDMSNKSCQETEEVLNNNGSYYTTARNIQAVEILKKMLMEKRLYIVYAKNMKDFKTIHSKGYLLKLYTGYYIGYIGSANLTYSGLHQNKEWMLGFDNFEEIRELHKDYMFEWNKLGMSCKKDNFILENKQASYKEGCKPKKVSIFEKIQNIFK